MALNKLGGEWPKLDHLKQRKQIIGLLRGWDPRGGGSLIFPVRFPNLPGRIFSGLPKLPNLPWTPRDP